MIEKEHTLDKEERERLKREIIAEIKEKKGGSRKTAGLIISGVGGLIYIFYGLFFFIVSYGYPPMLMMTTAPMIVAGVIAEIGTIVGIKNIKAGGGVILTAIPAAFVFGIIMASISGYPSYYVLIYLFQYLLFPIPIPHSIHVIPGGILCLTASDRKASEY